MFLVESRFVIRPALSGSVCSSIGCIVSCARIFAVYYVHHHSLHPALERNAAFVGMVELDAWGLFEPYFIPEYLVSLGCVLSASSLGWLLGADISCETFPHLNLLRL